MVFMDLRLYNIVMKTTLLMLIGAPLAYLLFGGAAVQSTTSDVEQLNITHAIVKTPTDNLPEPEHPVVIQIDHQGFPFDLNGNFPYVVMIDNKVYRYHKEEVTRFLEKAIHPTETTNLRTRILAN